jgi:hypothetical protein
MFDKEYVLEDAKRIHLSRSEILAFVLYKTVTTVALTCWTAN